MIDESLPLAVLLYSDKFPPKVPFPFPFVVDAALPLLCPMRMREKKVSEIARVWEEARFLLPESVCWRGSHWILPSNTFLSLVSHRFWLVRIGNDLAHATSSQKRQFAPDDNGIISHTGPAD